MRKVVVLLMAMGAILAVWLLFSKRPASKPARAETTTSAAAGPAALQVTSATPPPSQAELAERGSPLAAELNAADTPPERDVEILRELMSQYLTALQRRAGPPIGDDADLVRALSGRNPLRLAVLPADHPAISAEGRLLDRWGTPYHIHARGAQSFEFRSAGPDKRLFTEDDLLSP